ncbi:MAG: ABC transporter ATP-binding protein [Aeropyrum sp.]|nr:ABC transporter ATP-binding protein [Aeropyrum sp.]
MGLRVEVRDASKRFGFKIAYDQVSFEADSGILAVIGPNGAGKTTLLKTLVGLYRPSKGLVKVEGVDVSSPLFDRLLSKIGYVPETPDLPAWPTPCELLETLARLEGIDSLDARRVAREAASLMGLDEDCETRIGRLSKGVRKRILIAQAFMRERELYVLDEPYAGLDPEWVSTFRNLLLERARAGATIVISSHILREVEDLADRILVLKTQVRFVGSMQELKAKLSPSKVAVVIVDRPEEALEYLRRLGYQAVIDSSKGKGAVVLKDPDKAFEAAGLLRDSGFVVREVRLHEMSLEEAYLALVGGEKH